MIDFLLKAHLSLNDDLKPSRLTILQSLIDRCMSTLKSEAGKDPRRSVRVIDILKNLVHETETQGTSDVLPHGALLRGEQLDPLCVKNKATPMAGELMVQVYSNTTLWDLKRAVAEVLDLAPRYLQLSLGTQASSLTELKDIDNGKTMKAIGVTGGETLTLHNRLSDKTSGRPSPEDQVPAAALSGPDGQLTATAREVFGEWYEMFCDA